MNEEKPKSYYFTQFLLQRFIKNESKEEMGKNIRGDQIMHDPLELA